MKKSGNRLDPRATYKSPYFGDSKSGGDKVVNGGGREIIGIHGGADKDYVNGLGLISPQ